MDASSLSKLAVPMIDVAQSINTISAQEMQDRAVVDMNQALKTVPGVTIGAGEFRSIGTTPTIRGFVALPMRVLPPLFNRYTDGRSYGGHIDGAVRPIAGTPFRVRTDLSATLFLADPAEYDGGELVIGESGDEKKVKLPAGDLVLYSGGTVHRVMPVTRGVRLASFFWVQSMVRDETRRTILFDFDNALQQLGRTGADHDACVRLAGVYHNLLRQWADS